VLTSNHALSPTHIYSLSHVSAEREEISVIVDPNDIEGHHKRRKDKDDRLEAMKLARQSRYTLLPLTHA